MYDKVEGILLYVYFLYTFFYWTLILLLSSAAHCTRAASRWLNILVLLMPTPGLPGGWPDSITLLMLGLGRSPELFNCLWGGLPLLLLPLLDLSFLLSILWKLLYFSLPGAEAGDLSSLLRNSRSTLGRSSGSSSLFQIFSPLVLVCRKKLSLPCPTFVCILLLLSFLIV